MDHTLVKRKQLYSRPLPLPLQPDAGDGFDVLPQLGVAQVGVHAGVLLVRAACAPGHQPQQARRLVRVRLHDQGAAAVALEVTHVLSRAADKNNSLVLVFEPKAKTVLV